MSLDPKYIIAPSLEQYYVDKTTGEPLTEGTVEFFSDVDRAQHKAVFTLSGSPPNYSYVQLPNPSTLSGVGTFQDEDGNNVIPYYYPYDADGNVELYYIVVKDVDGVEQFTREGWPNITGDGDVENSNATNFIPNGQFLAHNDIPADPALDLVAGEIRADVTEIAQGGWTFERSTGSTADDNVTFFRFGEYVEIPTASPRYAIQIKCLSPDSGDVFKDLRVKFGDVNKFASDSQQYTLAFTGMTVDSGNFSVTLDLIKYFGTGGSPSATEITTITTFDLTSEETVFQIPFVFGNNDGDSIGTNNDDYVALAISFPTNISFGSQMTDFSLLIGDVVVSTFPMTTDRDFMARSLVPPTPDPDGSDLYLPLILTKDGVGYDDSDIGMVFAAQYAFTTSLSTTTNLMLGDGSQYLTAGYSPLGIPYARLQAKYWNSTLFQPIFGTGNNFVASYIQASSTSNLFIATNLLGAATPCADGVATTGFTFFPVRAASASGFNIKGYQSASNIVTAVSTTTGSVTDPSAGTSGFTVGIYRNTAAASSHLIFNITTVAATGLAGTYFTFRTNPGNIAYYMWFTVDGAGADPAPGGTGIKVDLKSTYTAADVATIVGRAISGCQIDVITTAAASTITGGDYFTFTPVGATQHAVWYSKDGVGSAPAISAFDIQVSILSADTAAQVAAKTRTAMNMTYFAAPQLQGAFLRGNDPTMIWDLDASTRFSFIPTIYGNVLGSFELDQYIAHTHTLNDPVSANNLATGANANVFSSSPSTSGSSGGTENRPINSYVNWVIRY